MSKPKLDQNTTVLKTLPDRQKKIHFPCILHPPTNSVLYPRPHTHTQKKIIFRCQKNGNKWQVMDNK